MNEYRFFAKLRKHAMTQIGFKAKASGGELQLEVYDVIGGDFFGEGITAANFSDAIKNAGDLNSITLRINSPGGDAFEGVAIYNVLKATGKPVNVFVDGLAASAASIVAMSGDKITMGDGAMMMIHNALALVMGNASEMRTMADTLDTVSASIADIYAKRTGMDKGDILKMMESETWMDVADAIAKGFADVEAKAPAKAKATAAGFNLSVYNNVPKKLKIVAEDTPADVDSYEDIIAEVASALNEAFPDKYWTCDTYPDNVIACDYAGSGDYFRIPYTEDEATEEYTFGTPQPVEKEWVPSAQAQVRLAKMPVKDPVIAVMRKRIDLMRARS
jgi:ATP-dependent Clp protease, protease subunit